MAPATEDKNPPLSFLRTLSSVLFGRNRIATATGKSFGGNRDLYESLGYPDTITARMYRGRYERGGIAGRIVDAYPHATWRGGGTIEDNADPATETEFEKVWGELERRLGIWPAFGRSDILAGLGEFSVLLIGAPGALEDPLDKFSAEDLLYVQPYGQEDVTVKTLVEDPADKRFGMPLAYQLDRSRATVASSSNVSRAVHWTRIIHVADGILDDNVNGKPRLRRVWNLLDDLDKIIGGGSEAFWLRAHQGYVFNLDKELEMDAGDIEDLKDQAEEFANQMRRTIGQRGIEVSPMGSDVADFHSPADAVLIQIAAATGIPHRILTGSERGELASSQDRNNWNERISDRRQAFAEPQVVRPFVDRLIEYGALPAPLEGDYEVKWPEIKNLDEAEKAKVAVQYATVNKQQGATVVTPDEIREGVLDLPPLDELDTMIETIGEGEEDEPPDGGAELEDEAQELAAARRQAIADFREGELEHKKKERPQ
jgi:hypothetical protein